jgi:anti-sigma B factor antagonist
MEMHIQHPTDTVTLIRLKGKFTIEDINQFKEKTESIEKGPAATVLIGFTDLEYIDSSGIGSLMLLMNMAKNRGITIVIYDLQDEIKNVFRISYLDKFFNITTASELKKDFPDIHL